MCRVDAPARLPMSFDFVCLHIHAASPEPHTLCFKSEALFDGGISREFDLPASPQHALPR